MGAFSIWHILIVVFVVVILFGGGGRISNSLGELGKGIRNFRKGLSGDEAKTEAASEAQKAIEKPKDQ